MLSWRYSSTHFCPLHYNLYHLLLPHFYPSQWLRVYLFPQQIPYSVHFFCSPNILICDSNPSSSLLLKACRLQLTLKLLLASRPFPSSISISATLSHHLLCPPPVFYPFWHLQHSAFCPLTLCPPLTACFFSKRCDYTSMLPFRRVHTMLLFAWQALLCFTEGENGGQMRRNPKSGACFFWIIHYWSIARKNAEEKKEVVRKKGLVYVYVRSKHFFKYYTNVWHLAQMKCCLWAAKND